MDKYTGMRLNDRYEIDELIGRGGMSNVYKALDIKTNRIVAIKILRDEYLTNSEFLKRFKNESKAIASLSSVNIVNVFDVSFNERCQWIAMEYINGITLKEYITKKRILTCQEAIYFVTQILKALQHAHDKGIVHRDIKPQNIMLLEDGTVKVTDFGIARFIRNAHKTITDKAIGSVHYISPEQAKGQQTDEKTDLYSVGVVLFEMVTGKLPFDADNPVSIALKQIQTKPIRPRQINSVVPEGLEQIIMKAMQKNVNNRYQSAAQMLNDLTSFKRNPSKIFYYESKSLNSDSSFSKNAKQNFSNYQNDIDMQKKKEISDKLSNAKNPMSLAKVLVIVACVFSLVTIGIIAGALFLSGLFFSVPNLITPNLIGQDYKNAINEKKYSKFKIQLETTEYCENYPEGLICEQNPKANRNIKENTIIHVKVSKGQKTIKMPNVIGKEFIIASSELKSEGINIKEIRVNDENIPENTVIKTQPQADTNVLLGSEVIVYISDGPENEFVIVPDLTNLDLKSAKILLESLKLQLGPITYKNSNEPEGNVLLQSPTKGSNVKVYAVIAVQVSTGGAEDGSDEQEKANQPKKNAPSAFNLKVDLPNIEGTHTVEAILDDNVFAEEEINMSEQSNWPIRLKNTPGTHKLKITIDKKTYREYYVNFDEQKVIKDVDNKSDFENY